MKQNVNHLITGNKEILDYRNLPLINRFKICWNLILFGIVDIAWEKIIIKDLEEKE